MNESPPILQVSDLHVHYPITGLFDRVTGWVKSVDGVSFALRRGATMGLVGESGSGKTTLARAIVKLAAIRSGSIRYCGEEIGALSEHEFFPYRKKIQMIFQDPYGSLNPRMTIFQILNEPLQIHFPQWSAATKRQRVEELLLSVGLEPSHSQRYPHEFSGGQRQRIGIARALAVEPEFIICDEVVSALDVSVQARIINLLQDLQEQLHLTYLFIGHDLAVVKHMSDEILVMTEGKIVEQAPASKICADPQHPYTRKLLAADLTRMG